MIIRKIRPDEYKRCQEFCALAFEYALEGADKSPEQMLADVRERPRSRQHLYWDSQWAAFADDDATMLSTMTVIPYTARFDGHDVPMTGIGGVATLPPYRRHGGIRACFERALPAMHEEGAVLSYLYPFSTVFYRKFGYELGCSVRRWKIALRGVPAGPVRGSWKLLERGCNLLKDIRQVDQPWQERYNCMVRCEEIEYAWVQEAHPFADRQYTYVYYGEEGAAQGYVTYRPVMDEGDRALECLRFVFTGPSGFRGLMALLLSLSADHSHVILTLPDEIDLSGLLPEWSFGFVACQHQLRGMARVINAGRALRLARMRGAGRLVLEIADAQIPPNNGRFAVAFAPGRENAVSRTDDPPDIRLGIESLTRLLLGRHDVQDIPWLPDVQMLCSPERASPVFYKKPMFISQFF